MFIISDRRAGVFQLSCGHFAIGGHVFQARPLTCGLGHGASPWEAIGRRKDLGCWAQSSCARRVEPSLGRATGLQALLQCFRRVPIFGIPGTCHRQILHHGSAGKATGRGAHRRLGPRHKRFIAVVRRPPASKLLLFVASGRLRARTALTPRLNSDTKCKSVYVLYTHSK